jgi:hypothetical protein
MAAYDGPVSIVIDDGSVIDEVVASLVCPEEQVGDEPWFGTIRGDFDAFDLMDGTPTLRIPDGRASSFKLLRTDLVVPRQGIEVVGLSRLA